MSDGRTTRGIGRAGEGVVCLWLESQGHRVVCRNYTAPHGEIDIISECGKYIVFTEVKLRSDTAVQKRFGRPSHAVNAEKKRHILAAASEYLRTHPTGKQPRIDVCEVLMEKWAETGAVSFRIHNIERAFGAESK